MNCEIASRLVLLTCTHVAKRKLHLLVLINILSKEIENRISAGIKLQCGQARERVNKHEVFRTKWITKAGEYNKVL